MIRVKPVLLFPLRTHSREMTTDTLAAVRRRHPVVVAGALEGVVVLGLWVAYSLSRLVASAALAPARDRAEELLAAERRLGLAWEGPLNRVVARLRRARGR